MTKADATEFNKELDKIRLSSSFDEAIQKFYDICSKFKFIFMGIIAFLNLKENFVS
jgi:hypothetical protein